MNLTLDKDPYTSNGYTKYFGRESVFSDYLGTNSSFTAADMVASITMTIPDTGNTVSTTLGTLQTLSYSIDQAKTPVRNLGNMNAKDWVFGPRTIAGSLVFAVFNKHWLINIYDKIKTNAKMKNCHFIADELPPFDITISFANEYGFDSRLVIYGVRLLREGQVMSVSDIYIENTYTFVASDIDLLDSLSNYQSDEDRHRSVLVKKETRIIVNDDLQVQLPEPDLKGAIVASEVAQQMNEEDQKIRSSLTFTNEQIEGYETAKKALKALKDIYNKYPGDIEKQYKELYVQQKDRITEYYNNKNNGKTNEEGKDAKS